MTYPELPSETDALKAQIREALESIYTGELEAGLTQLERLSDYQFE